MAFTLWLSAEEERLLSEVMRAEGARTKQQAIISALRDKASALSGNTGTPRTSSSFAASAEMAQLD